MTQKKKALIKALIHLHWKSPVPHQVRKKRMAELRKKTLERNQYATNYRAVR